MSTVYVVTSGEYSAYGINKVFGDLKSAEKYCALENSKRYSDERCHIEFYEVNSGESHSDDIDIYRYINCQFQRSSDSGHIYIFCWGMEISKDPVEFSMKDGRWAGEFEATIPVNKTYNMESEKDQDIVRKIVADYYYMWLALKLGI